MGVVHIKVYSKTDLCNLIKLKLKIKNLCFKILKKIQQQVIDLQIPNVEMKELSMGMSGDLEAAIEEGATIIRVGTAIFGQRIYPDSYYWDEQK